VAPVLKTAMGAILHVVPLSQNKMWQARLIGEESLIDQAGEVFER
jgi:hypothetical protein